MAATKVWVCTFDNRPPEVWTGNSKIKEDILHRDINGGYIDPEDEEFPLEIDYDPEGNERSWYIDDWGSGELVEVYGNAPSS